jgi:hypothetical protein
VHHDHAGIIVELHALHDRVLQPQQGTPYPCFLHAEGESEDGLRNVVLAQMRRFGLRSGSAQRTTDR